MNYEEKYKQALERAMKLALTGNVSALAAGEIFSELKESEDERIRKEIVDFITSSNKYGTNERCEAWLNWLKKQGENVEIKFCSGDKVVSNQDGKVYTVGTAYYVTGDNICLHDTDGNHKWTNRDDLDKNYHLWTSEDAKKINADEVIEWLKINEPKFWESPCNPDVIIEQFKKDFGL